MTGLGCLASNTDAVRAIYALKGRDDSKPLTLFVADAAAAENVTGPLEPRVRAWLKLAWPGAVTAVLPLAGGSASGGRWPAGRDGTVGMRVPAHPLPLALVRLAGGPLATTSANPAGTPPFRDVAEAAARWGSRVLGVPPETCASAESPRGGIASTVVDLTRWPPRVLRAGAVDAGLLAEWLRKAG